MPEEYKAGLEYDGWTCTKCNRVWAKERKECPGCGAKRILCDICGMFFCEYETVEDVILQDENGFEVASWGGLCEGCFIAFEFKFSTEPHSEEDIL